MEISMPVSRSAGSHGDGDIWHVVPRCNDDQVQNHNYEHYSIPLLTRGRKLLLSVKLRTR
jgi:hypothetical protein